MVDDVAHADFVHPPPGEHERVGGGQHRVAAAINGANDADDVVKSSGFAVDVVVSVGGCEVLVARPAVESDSSFGLQLAGCGVVGYALGAHSVATVGDFNISAKLVNVA